MAKKKWADLSPRQQQAVIVGGVLEILLTAAAVNDLIGRPDSQVRGSKALWLLSFVVQPFGPLAYYSVGRRPPE
jgi:hypothetical protein